MKLTKRLNSATKFNKRSSNFNLKEYSTIEVSKNLSNEYEDIINKLSRKNIKKNKNSNKKFCSLKIFNYSTKKQNSFYQQFNFNNNTKDMNSINQFSTTTTFDDKTSFNKTYNKAKNLKNENALTFEDRNLIKQKTRKYAQFSPLYKNNNKDNETDSYQYLLNKENQLYKTSKNKFKKVKYSLKELIKLDPYHLLNTGVKDQIQFFMKKVDNYKRPNIGNNIKTSEGHFLRVLENKTLLLKTIKDNTEMIKKLMKSKHNTYMEFEYIIKWEGISHLWKKHLVIINTLLAHFDEHLWFINKNEFITMNQFNEFLHLIMKIASSKNDYSCFVEDVFYLFSYDKKTTNMKKLYSTFIITNNNMLYDDKINFLCNIWENNQSGEIIVKDLLYYIKNNLKIKSDYSKIFSYFNQNHHIDYHILKKDVYDIFISEMKVRNYFERNCQINYEKIEKEFEDIVYENYVNHMNSLGYNMSNHDVKIRCLRDIEHFDKILQIIDDKNETKHNLKKIFNE